MTANDHDYPTDEGSLTSMLALVKRRADFRRVLVGSMISQVGDWLSYIAVSLVTVSSGEGGLALAGAYLSHTLPSALMAPWAGRVADRFDRRLIMVWAYVAAAVVTAMMVLAAMRGEVWTLQALTCLRTSLSSFGTTARQAATPSLVERSELYTANALSSMVWSTLFTAGVALGGALTATLGATVAIGVDALTFLVAIYVIWALPKLTPVDDLGSESDALTRDFGLWSCWRSARQDPHLASALLAKCPLGLINSAGWMTLTLLASKVFGDTTGAILGLFHAARAIGTGLGPLLLRHVWPSSAVVSTLWAIPATIGLLWSEWLPLSILCLLLWGMFLGYTWVRSSADIQRLAPPVMLGRLSAFDYSCSTVCQAASIITVGALYDLGLGLSTGVYLLSVLTFFVGFWLFRLEQRAPLSYEP